jgi:hypothetical protein
LLNIKIFPEQIGGSISENGNPVIQGIDTSSGIVVSIEINSQNWKEVLAKLGRLEGVGIVPANLSRIIPTGRNHGE